MSLTKLIHISLAEYGHLPWRKKRTLYRTLVSEIMLQQTTVSTVINKFEDFLKEYPTIEVLAQASEESLLISWKGLGYYRRARNLKKAAEFLNEKYKGKFPNKLEELKEIPGVGDYTANAILAIGRDKKALAIDANLERVIARLYQVEMEKGPKLQKEILRLFNEGVVFKNFKGSFRELNEALMDLGRVYCQSRKADCEICPMNKQCLSFENINPLTIPIVTKVKKNKEELKLLRIIVTKKDLALAYKKSDKEWLSGQYEIPTFVLSCTDKKLQQYPAIKRSTNSKLIVKTAITKYKIENFIEVMSYSKFNKEFSNEGCFEFVSRDKLSSASIKSLNQMKKSREEE